MDIRKHLEELEEKIGYTFHDKELLEHSMRHMNITWAD